MTVSRQQISWGVWPLWVAACAAGNALGAAAFLWAYFFLGGAASGHREEAGNA